MRPDGCAVHSQVPENYKRSVDGYFIVIGCEDAGPSLSAWITQCIGGHSDVLCVSGKFIPLSGMSCPNVGPGCGWASTASDAGLASSSPGALRVSPSHRCGCAADLGSSPPGPLALRSSSRLRERGQWGCRSRETDRGIMSPFLMTKHGHGYMCPRNSSNQRQ